MPTTLLGLKNIFKIFSSNNDLTVVARISIFHKKVKPTSKIWDQLLWRDQSNTVVTHYGFHGVLHS